MPTCPSCGKAFTGISFGSEVADVCRDCRVARRKDAEAKAYTSGSPAAIAAFETPAVTYWIIGINVLVYFAMGISGASWTEPNTLDAIKWGGDFGPLTLSHEWWRVVTSTFVHFGIFHIALNMICFWDLGQGLEPLMGRRAFLFAYAISGVTASVVSLYWNPWRVSAGASGAIFGIAGTYLTYLYFRKTDIDQVLLKKRLRSLLVFIFYNLLYGLRPGVDNSAHIGGLVAGLILGFMIPPRVLMLVAGTAGAQVAMPGVSPAERGTMREEHSSHLALIGLACFALLVVAFVQLRVSHPGMVAYGDAALLAKRGDMVPAVAKMEAAAELDPGTALADDWVAEEKLVEGDGAGAITHFEKVLQTYPNDPKASFNLALAYLASGDATSALRLATQAGTRGRYEAGWDFVAGAAALQFADLTSAKEFVPAAAEKNRKLWEAQAALAELRVEEGNIDAARGIYTQILKIDPANEVAKANLEILSTESKIPPTAKDLKPFDIPYAQLVLKSDAWPYYP